MSGVRSAVGWSALDVLFRNGLSLLVTMILARLLVPEDFGIIAILGLFLSVASLFVDGGFSQALIQNQSATHEDESSIFYFNVGMGTCLSLTVCLIAPWIAAFYELPSLRNVTIGMAAILLIDSLGSVHNALLIKKLEFATVAKVGGFATLLGGVSGITAALTGLGVWSLVIQVWTVSIVTVAMLWYLHPWRPGKVMKPASIRRYFRFSGFQVLSNLMFRVYGNVFATVIGKVHTARDAGYYSQAHRLQQLASLVLTSIVARVAFPVFSASNHDQQKLRRDLAAALDFTMFVSVPVALTISLFAREIVLVLFGHQWLPSVPVVQVLGLSAMLMPLQMLNINMLKAMGRTDLNFRVMLVKFVVGMSLLFFAVPHGLVAIAWAFVLSNVINFLVNTYYTHSLLSFGVLQQFRHISGYLISALPLILVVAGFRELAGIGAVPLVLVALPLGLASYLGTCLLLRLAAPDLIRRELAQLRSAKRS